MGRSVFRAISRTIDSVNAPPTVDTPIRIVTRTRPITSASPIRWPDVCGHPASAAARLGVPALLGTETPAHVVQEAASIDDPDAAPNLRLR